MSTPIRKPTEAQAMAWLKANPDATDEELKAYVNGTMPPSPVRFKAVQGFGRGAAQGVTMGLADEIVGGVKGALTPGVTMGEAIDQYRANDKAVGGAAYTVGNIAGGVAAGVGAAGLAMSRSGALATLLGKQVAGGVGARALAGAAAGAAGGAAGAFGSAEGNPLERLPEALMGGAFGGVTGGALPFVGAGARALGNTTGIRPRMVNPATESADIINEGIRQGGATHDGLIATAQKDPSVPQTLMDLGPDQVGDVARGVQSRSNEARIAARDYQETLIEGERERYIQRVGSVMNPDDKDIVEVAAELRDLRRANAERNFNPKVLDQPIKDVGVASFFREKEVVRAYQEFRENQLTRLRAGEIGEEDVPPEIYRITTGEDGKKRLAMKTTDIPLRAFHVVQQAVNEAISNGLTGGKVIPKKRAQALLSAMNKHMDTVEDAVPEYGAARRMYREDSAPVHALAAGRGQKPPAGEKAFTKGVPNFATSSAQDVQKWIDTKRAAGDDVSATELEHYLLGVYGYVRDQLKGKANPGAWLDLPKNREKVVAALGSNADEFVSAMKAESRKKAVSSVSRKGAGIEGDETIPTVAMDVVLASAGAATGRPYATTASVGRLLRGEHRVSDGTAKATIDRLFKGVNSLEEFIGGMEDLKRAQEAQVRRRARIVGATAGATAGTATAAGGR